MPTSTLVYERTQRKRTEWVEGQSRNCQCEMQQWPTCSSLSLVRRSVIVFIWARPTRLSPPWHWQSQADNYDLAHCPCKQADGLGNICLAAECFWLWEINACTPTPCWPKYSKQDFFLIIFLKQLQSHFAWLTNIYAKAAGPKLILNLKTSTGFVLTSSDNETVWVIHMWESDRASSP